MADPLTMLDRVAILANLDLASRNFPIMPHALERYEATVAAAESRLSALTEENARLRKAASAVTSDDVRWDRGALFDAIADLREALAVPEKAP